MEIITWILANKVTLLAILGSVHGLASLIAALTPTDKDDEFLRKTRKVVDMVALNVGHAKKPETTVIQILGAPQTELIEEEDKAE